jgi:hypothetical protein
MSKRKNVRVSPAKIPHNERDEEPRQGMEAMAKEIAKDISNMPKIPGFLEP